jgi:DNA polymerase IIIc chi subunit
MINVFYIGRDYSAKTDDQIGVFYEITEKGFKRIDMEHIEAVLKAGEEVCLQPANKKQLERINELLGNILFEKV